MGEIELCSCCLTPYLTALACVALAALWLLRRAPAKVDAATAEYIERAADVPQECQAIIAALKEHGDDSDEEKKLDEAAAVLDSASRMRAVLRSGSLPLRALADDPGALLRASPHMGHSRDGALHTRFTVSYNLYAGSVVGLGTDEQREALYETQAAGELGCFAFTERGTGVLSGAAVETTATFDGTTGGFVIQTPADSAQKNWISQGCVAERAVILADLIDGEGVRRGPHLFWARIAAPAKGTMFKSGEGVEPVAGVTVGSVPRKTALRSLDNATLRFDGLRVEREALLARFATVDECGAYKSMLPPGCKRMEDVLLSRLLTGRVVLSEYTLGVAHNLLRRSWAYCGERELWRGSKPRGKKMREMSNVERTFADYGRALALHESFAASVREDVVKCIETEAFTQCTFEGCCVVKFLGTSYAVDTISVLRKLLGSQALFEESWLGASSFVANATCAAEGDNTIMQLKVVSDIVKGRAPLVPAKVSAAVLATPAGRRAALAYAYGLLRATLKGKAAIKDGQLLTDIAYARAHLMVLAAWRGPRGWIDSYERVCVRFPTPICF